MGWLTGAIQKGAGNYIAKNSPSIDQVLATRLSAGKAYASLQLAIRWATGKVPRQAVAHQRDELFRHRTDSAAAGSRRISSTRCSAPWRGARGPAERAAVPTRGVLAANRRKSILDFVDKKYAALETKLGADDRARLDQHLTQIRSLEQRMIGHLHADDRA